MNGDDVGDMPMKLAAQGASGGALGRASRGDLAQGFTRLDEAEQQDGGMEGIFGGTVSQKPFSERPLNEVWTERDTGGFLDRPHGLER